MGSHAFPFTVMWACPCPPPFTVLLRAVARQGRCKALADPSLICGGRECRSAARVRRGRMRTFGGLNPDDSTFRALRLILEAWDEATESGVPTEQMAYAALFTALTDLVAQFGEEAVIKLARGLEERINLGEFS